MSIDGWQIEERVTLRDYFAAKAISGLCTDLQPMRVISSGDNAGSTEAALAAKQAYLIADEMLKAKSA